jgi:hypothetical protein
MATSRTELMAPTPDNLLNFANQQIVYNMRRRKNTEIIYPSLRERAMLVTDGQYFLRVYRLLDVEES